MLRSPIARWGFGLLLFIAVLGVLRFKPWQQGGGSVFARQELKVGFLPVT